MERNSLMEKIFDKENKSYTQILKVNRINKRIVIPMLVVVLMITMACNISYEGIDFTDKPETPLIEINPETEEQSQPQMPQQAVPTPEPTYQREESKDPEAEAEKSETNEYSVTAENFDCICQVNGNVTQVLSVKGDQLFFGEGEGEQVYEKIGENTYKRSWMGYYILREDGKDTKVDEEQSTVIILTDNGHIMEHYKGSNSSPCCVYTFTQTK